MKYKVLLFQPYLRQHILNLGKRLTHFDFVYQQGKGGHSYPSMPSFEEEISRRKDTSWLVRLRRLLGIPNVRIKFSADADILFTYGCLLITNKPYCTYVETAFALFNYDPHIAKNRIAKMIVTFLATRQNCHKLIFLSEAGRKSFFATIHNPPRIEKILKEKSIVVYPAVDVKATLAKEPTRSLKLLFAGQFYMKGGLELVHAYEKLRKRWPTISLTIITAIRMLRDSDVQYLHSIPGLQLLDAKFNAAQMNEFYESHDIFILPTYREGFGLVVVEAIAHAMPVITTDQYAVAEMVEDGKSGFVYTDHPMKDYDPKTHEMFGRYHNPSEFYADLFHLQKEGKLKPVEDFIESSIEKFLANPDLLTKMSHGSLNLYRRKFDAQKMSAKLEGVFRQAVGH